ncbi:hypothetical protein BN988_01626 [Oceanobacillus picturae]|uniref:YubB ferredoxin-like domain-containing protein n=1 Tax=Oceanobacillus picturae TaxID=171693 RepID=W9AKE8_9BACI|nr:hypothetical protein [Oceanobacillus picturae]CDO03126.1 hypothetical protein BN988_01626 [Oceanobacillus picturae]
MPNWAEGVLKIRGTRQDIKKFLMEGLSPLNPFGGIAMLMGKETDPPEVQLKEDEWDLNMSAPHGFYIEGTRRAFIEGGITWDFDDKHIEILTIEDFKQAWAVITENFVDISEKFNLDIKIYAFEYGMEFNQDIEIHKGKVIRDNEITFDDYQWECLYPNLGG